jgi:hypothetical protein
VLDGSEPAKPLLLPWPSDPACRQACIDMMEDPEVVEGYGGEALLEGEDESHRTELRR